MTTSVPKRDLVVTVHGIRTYGHWQERLAALLVDNEVSVYNYKYGYFSVVAFAIPFLRWLVTRRFRRDFLRIATENEWRTIHIVSHSFGTHLVAWSLWSLRRRGLRVDTVILAGSVLKSHFRWDELLGTTVGRVVNECGARDKILVLNQVAVLFTGMAGRSGFAGMTGENLVNRYYLFGHSGYFEADRGKDDADEFMRERWVPLLRAGAVAEPHDERGAPTVTDGIINFALNNVEPLKLLAVLAPVILATATITSWRDERVRLDSASKERRDLLLISAAAQVVRDNPTDTIATLKQMDPTSKFWHGAWVVASDAMARGVATTCDIGTKSSATTLAVMRGGGHIVTGTSDGKLSILSPQGKRLRLLNGTASIVSVRPIDQTAFVALDDKGQLTLWNIDTGSVRRLATITPEPDNRPAVGVSHDGLRVVVAIRDRVSVIDVDSGKQRSFILPRREGVDRVQMSPDGRFVGITDTKSVSVIDLRRGTVRTRRFGDFVHDAVFYADSKQLIVSASSWSFGDRSSQSLDKFLLIWDLLTGRIGGLPVGDCGTPEQIVAVDERTIVAARAENTELCVWSAANNFTAEVFKAAEHEAETGTGEVGFQDNIRVSPSGENVAVVSNNPAHWIFVWNLRSRTATTLKGLEESAGDVEFVDDRHVANIAGSRVYLWTYGPESTAEERIPREIDRPGLGGFTLGSVSIAAKGTTVAFCKRPFLPGEASFVKVWERAAGNAVRSLEFRDRGTYSVHLNDEGSRLAVLFSDGLFEIRDARTMKALVRYERMRYGDVAANGTLFVTVEPETITIWEMRTRDSRPSRRRVIQASNVVYAALNGDGDVVAGVTRRELVLWTKKGEERYALSETAVGPPILSADSQTIAVPVQRGVLVFRQAEGLVAQTHIAGAWLQDFSLSPDGSLVACSSADGLVTLWDVDTNAKRILLNEAMNNFSVRFRSNTKLAVSDGSEIREWDLRMPDNGRVARAALDQATNVERPPVIFASATSPFAGSPVRTLFRLLISRISPRAHF